MKKLLNLAKTLLMGLVITGQIALAQTLDPGLVPKFTNDLPVIRDLGLRVELTAGTNIDVSMQETEQDLLGMGMLTKVWGYNFPQIGVPTYPGATIVTYRDERIQIQWNNELPMEHMLPVDPSLHMARPTAGIATVTHLHGGHTESASDGLPEAWFTQGFAETGATFVKERYVYDNSQEAGTLWYHDHALGITRLNVYAGLAGFYFLRDDNELNLINTNVLPAEPYEVELVFQDRMFDESGQLFFPSDPSVPEVDPEGDWCDDPNNPNGGCEDLPNETAVAEFFGDIILVNGKAWPKYEVEPRKYRFRLLNGSDSRFYILKFENGSSYRTFHVIGTDDALLPQAVAKTELLLAPGERYDIVVDFTGMSGQSLVLENWAGDEPFKGFTAGGDLSDGEGGTLPPADPATTGKLMKFNISKSFDNGYAEASVVTGTTLRPAIAPLVQDGATRNLVLFEGLDEFGRLQPLLGTLEQGSQAWFEPITENPMLNDTEVWEVYNTTADAHPIHLHLVSFQILDRRPFEGEVEEKYQIQHDGSYGRGGRLEAGSIVIDEGAATGPESHEAGWKDTAVMYPGQVTRVIAKFDRPGRYVWHCHILSHEDHEMMRPFHVGDGTHKDQYLLLADDRVRFQSLYTAYGDVYSNGRAEFKNGDDGMLHGDVTAVDKIDIRERNTIHGDVTSGDRIRLYGDATVTGTISDYDDAVEEMAIPDLAPFSYGSDNVKVSAGEFLALPPGDYKQVKVYEDAILKLEAGVYNVQRLYLNKRSTLEVDAQLGAVTVNIDNKLDVVHDAEVVIDNGTSRDLTFNIDGSSSHKIRDGSIFQGNIIAPKATIRLQDDVYFKGSICAKRIEVYEGVELHHHGIDIMPHAAKVIAQGNGEAGEENGAIGNLPTEYSLDQNYPNPFNPTTTVRFALPEASNVTLKIYNILGQEVYTLARGNLEAGFHTFQWNATDQYGSRVASGIYIYRLQAGHFVQTKKMLLVK
ncbi:MAG: multicopper oxidase domain-containing protein [Calditrichae bacterium]|nr:multicopper oxidase domain-containing protein [Calditrichia bacterium]